MPPRARWRLGILDRLLPPQPFRADAHGNTVDQDFEHVEDDGLLGDAEDREAPLLPTHEEGSR